MTDEQQHQLDRRAERALHTQEFLRHHPEYQTPKEDPVSKPKIPTEIRATVPAWFCSDWRGPQDLLGKPEEAVCAVTLTVHDMTSQGWSRAGEAEIVLRPLSLDQMVEQKVEALRGQKSRVLADAQREATEIEGRIQELLAISYDAPQPVADDEVVL